MVVARAQVAGPRDQRNQERLQRVRHRLLVGNAFALRGNVYDLRRRGRRDGCGDRQRNHETFEKHRA